MSTPASVSNAGVYTPQDHDAVATVKKWLAEHDKSNAWLGKKASIPNGTLSQILSAKYVSSPTKQLNQLLSVLQVEESRLSDGPLGYVDTTVHKLMRVVFDRTRKNRNFGVFSGYVGVGKTSFCKHYKTSQPMTLLVESNPNMTVGVLLDELLNLLNVPIPTGLDRKFREVVRVLSGTNYLLLVDEAERLSAHALEYLRRIRDKAEVGVCLVGTEKLTQLLKAAHGKFDQVRSRVGMWPKTVERITRNDADELARAALADALGDGGAIEDDVLDALWAYSEGSARVLIEAMIPAIKDYGIEQLGKSGAELIDKIAQKVLFMPVRSMKGGAA